MVGVMMGVGGCVRTQEKNAMKKQNQVAQTHNTGSIEETKKSDSKNISANVNEYGIAESVVAILCPFADQPFDLTSSGYGGSGTLISGDGIIITNSHVIPQTEDSLFITKYGCFIFLPNPDDGIISSSNIYVGQPIVVPSTSDEYDLARIVIYGKYTDTGRVEELEINNLISLNNDGCDQTDKRITLRDEVFLYGYPSYTYGVSQTVTDGIVSSLLIDGSVAVSAKIDAGNSGGLVLDEKGCFMGIPSSVRFGETEEISIIIPADTVSHYLNITGPQDDLKGFINFSPNKDMFPGYLIRYDDQNFDINVAIVQKQLNLYGYDLDVDGYFGPKTLEAIKSFQSTQGLEVDGIIGPKTWEVLFKI